MSPQRKDLARGAARIRGLGGPRMTGPISGLRPGRAAYNFDRTRGVLGGEGMKVETLVVLLVIGLLGMTRAADDPVQTELAKLSGTYRMVRGEEGGKAI